MKLLRWWRNGYSTWSGMVCERPWFQVLVGTRLFTTCPNVTGGEKSSINQDSEPGPLVYCAMHRFNHWAIDTLHTDRQPNTKHQRCVQQSRCSGALAKICDADLENLVKILENLVSTCSAKPVSCRRIFCCRWRFFLYALFYSHR